MQSSFYILHLKGAGRGVQEGELVYIRSDAVPFPQYSCRLAEARPWYHRGEELVQSILDPHTVQVGI